MILHTGDGGKSWQKQESHAVFKDRDGSTQDLYLFGLYAIDNDHAWAVGDRSILTSTSDGGRTWRARTVPMETDLSGGQSLATADPIFYDVMFTDLEQGWIVGEFGKIMHTTDGGETWHEQERSLMEGTSTIDVLDLPTLYGVHMMPRAWRATSRARRTASTGRSTRSRSNTRSSTRSSASSSFQTTPGGRSGRRVRSCGVRPGSRSGSARTSVRTCLPGSAASASPTRNTAGWWGDSD